MKARKLVYFLAAGAGLLVLQSASWIVERMRRPFVHEAADPQRATYYAPPEAAVCGCRSVCAEMARQFGVWG
jgi:hypothetical protein